MHFLLIASVAPVTVTGCLSGCGEAESVLGGEAGNSGTGMGEAQSTRLMLLPLLSPSLPSASLATREPSPMRAIPTSNVLYGLRRVLDLLALGEAVRAMDLGCLVMPTRFTMSFPIGWDVLQVFFAEFLADHRSLCCVRARGKGGSCDLQCLWRDVLLDTSQLVPWAQKSLWAAVGGVDPPEKWPCGQFH